LKSPLRLKINLEILNLTVKGENNKIKKGMYFIEGSNFNRGQKYFSGGQKYSSGGQKYFIEGSNFIGGQKYFIWGSKIL
jgi:hypothetical protein